MKLEIIASNDLIQKYNRAVEKELDKSCKDLKSMELL